MSRVISVIWESALFGRLLLGSRLNHNLALTSGTIKAMLSGPGSYSENETNEVNFREIPSHVLQKVCQYFAYKVRYTNSATEIPEFSIAPEVALELLMAANFLDC
ncbi:Transcription elongation factor B, polypeptide 1 [Dirofilaria immitis]|nr:Transcription elongation factor B, polypeptide 1 [Dirofilaria immitis]